MNNQEIKNELESMPKEELKENLAYLIGEMEESEQREFLGLE